MCHVTFLFYKSLAVFGQKLETKVSTLSLRPFVNTGPEFETFTLGMGRVWSLVGVKGA